MSTVSKVFIFIVVGALVGAAVAVVTWDIAPPLEQVEEVIPNKQLLE